MTTDTDKLVETAQAAGFCYVGGTLFAHDIDLTPKLAAFADAHVASLCADVEPVFETVSDGKLYPASVVAAITAQRDAAMARVAELEKDAARYRLLRRGQKWSTVDGIGTVLRAETLDAAIDAAMAKD